ncbi:MAG TPA: hypothetical protein VFZ61_20825, partial [Polyangiales bacterium]
MHPGSNGKRALALHDLERQLSVICRRAVRATLLASALSPAVGCSSASTQRREVAPRPAPVQPPPEVQASAAASEAQPDAAPPPAPLPAVFDAENATPAAPPAASEQFVAFPCATPTLERADQERIWNDQTLYERFARMQARLEYDLRARSLTPGAPVDSLTLSRATHAEMVRVAGQQLSMVNDRLAEHGTPCAQAPDKGGCEAELKRQADAIWANERCDEQECRPFYYVYAQTTRGAEVKTYVAKAGLQQLFGAIDTPTEAWFLLAAEHIFEGFACGDAQHAAYRTVAGGHELRGAKFTSSCRPLTQKELTYRVDQAGKVRLVKQRVLSNEPQGCVVSGRRPPGLGPVAAQERDLAGYLARAAHLETASVQAFD